ncbi:MAG TPA: molybdenum cofactor guanylyltransferase [Candidatus Limnocylindria bacterium]|nr:molybdenum cofactor guanylyltransferase [Candidatus Limnocylindria bacterium]
MSVSAAIMAGGKSKRMGQDKAWIELDGEPLITRVAGVLAEVADDVLIVANDPTYERLGLRVVHDRWPDGGALGGIATGVGAALHDTVLVAACDMPFLSADVWRLLLGHVGDADVVIPRIGGEYETLHALYAKACVPQMARAIAENRLRVISFFDAVTVKAIEEPELRVVDPTLRAFTNVNTPEELAEALLRR